jgi:hypothetical protein
MIAVPNQAVASSSYPALAGRARLTDKPRQTITATQKYLSGIKGRNGMVKNVTVIS